MPPFSFKQATLNLTPGLSVAFTSANILGNTLIAMCGEEASVGTITAVVDTNLNDWVLLPQETLNHTSVMAYALNCKAGANTVSFTVSGTPSGFGQISVAEYQGATFFDSGDGSTFGLPSVSPAFAPVLVIGAADDSYGTFTLGGGGYTLRTPDGSGGNVRTGICDQTFMVPGTYSPDWTFPPNVAGGEFSVMAFLDAPPSSAAWVNRHRYLINKRGHRM